MNAKDTAANVERRGRTFGQATFALVVASFTVVCAIQIIQQVWFPRVSPSELGCRAGTLALLDAVKQARNNAEVELGERESVARFRSAVEPTWGTHDFFREQCRSDKTALKALDAIDRLRYAEEHALRFEAGEIAGLRRRLERLAGELQRDNAGLVP